MSAHFHEVFLSDSNEEEDFLNLLNILRENFNIRSGAHIRGLDHQYIDFFWEGTEFSLHCDHYLGISLRVSGLDADILPLNSLEKALKNHLK